MCANSYMPKIYKLLNSLEGIYFSIHFMSNMSKEHEIRVKMKFKENKFRRSGGWNDFFIIICLLALGMYFLSHLIFR